MPSADLRALAAKAGLLKPCDCYGGCERCEIGNRGHGERWRLPTEAEVRAAIFEAGWPVIWASRVEKDYVVLQVCRPSEQREGVSSAADGVEADDLVLLALLRALEEVRLGTPG